jgi:hypothetical protein
MKSRYRGFNSSGRQNAGLREPQNREAGYQKRNHPDVTSVHVNGRPSNGHNGRNSENEMDTEQVSASTKEGTTQERTAKILDAFEHVLYSGDFTRTLECFRFTFEYRHGIPWLLESENFPRHENGLVWAIYDALDLYAFGVHKDLNLAGTTSLDQNFILKMKQAVMDLLMNHSNVDDFCHALARTGCDLDSMSVSELSRHVALALDEYCSRGRSNIENVFVAGLP